MLDLTFLQVSNCHCSIYFEWTLFRTSTETNRKQWCTVCTHRNANSLLKYISSTFNRNIVNQKVKHLSNLCFRNLCWTLCHLWQNKQYFDTNQIAISFSTIFVEKNFCKLMISDQEEDIWYYLCPILEWRWPHIPDTQNIVKHLTIH